MKMKVLFSADWLKLSVLLSGAAFFAPHSSDAGVIEAWVRQYNSVATHSIERGGKVVVDKAGDVIVAGHTEGLAGHDIFTIKYSGTDGSLIWKRLYDGPAHEEDEPRAITVDENKNIIVTGCSKGAHLDFDFYTAKYAASDGRVVWERRFNSTPYAWDEPRGVATDGNGNVIVAGHCALAEFYTAKYAADDGAILWERRTDFAGSLDHGSVVVDHNGDVVIAISRGGFGTLTRPDYYVAKYAAADGATLWEQSYNNPVNSADYPSGLALDRAGNVIVTGTTYGLNSTSVYHVIKYSAADGTPVWEQHIPNGFVASILADPEGDIVVSGYIRSSAAGTDRDYYTAKYAATNGAVLWEKRYDGPAHGTDFARGLAFDRNGNVLVTGISFDGAAYDCYTTKYAVADGTPLWDRRSGDFPYTGFPQSITTDDAGNVFVTGDTYRETEWYNLRTEKYNGATGALLWESEYNSLASGSDQARGVALDAQKNVIVAGQSWNGAEDVLYTAKYAAANGAILWERQYDGPGNSGEWLTAFALDTQGDAFVVGTEYLFYGVPGTGSSRTTETHLITKYAFSDGALLWQKVGPPGFTRSAAVLPGGDLIVTGSVRSNTATTAWHIARYASVDGTLMWENSGPGSSAGPVAVDPSGNIIALGSTNLVKYLGSDGTFLWQQRYNGPGGEVVSARALAVDSDGHVAITGTMSKTNHLDFYTAKYRSADGALLWGRCYSSATNSSDQPRSVAVDQNGNVIVGGSSSAGTNFHAYIAKYAARDGTLLWERLRPVAFSPIVAVDRAGDVVVAGNARSGMRTNYYAAKYSGASGAVLWEKEYGSVTSRGDILADLAISGDGVIAVTGSSEGALSPNASYDITTVVYWEKLPPVSIDRLRSGVLIRFSGIAGRVCHLQRADDINGPWTTLSTETAAASGVIEYLDNTGAAGSTFYRVRLKPLFE